MTNTILVAINGSPLSKRTFEQALAHADSTVVALHAIDLSGPGYSASLSAGISTEPLHGSGEWCEWTGEPVDDIFNELTALADGSRIEFQTEALRGNPAWTIADSARREGVDVVYLGGYGRTGETDLLLGSVAELVTLRAPTSVLVICRVRGGSSTSRSSPVSVIHRRQPATRTASERQKA